MVDELVGATARPARSQGRKLRSDLWIDDGPIALEPVDAVTITTLVDNMTDALIADSGPAKRAPFVLATAGEVLRAEHGFSCLVTISKAARTTRVLRRRDHTRRADREHAAARALAA